MAQPSFTGDVFRDRPEAAFVVGGVSPPGGGASGGRQHK